MIYPLAYSTWNEEEVEAIQKVVNTDMYTMGKHVKMFEQEFAKQFGSSHAVMVNSGSSANLLATFAACNPLRKNKFKTGDEAIIPSLCWPTSLWPLVQAGLKPKFVDVNPSTLNVDAKDLIKKTFLNLMLQI